MSKLFTIVGSFIKSKRVGLNLSQKELGLLLEPQVTTQFISNIERGATPLPSVHVIKLCRALQIQEEELVLTMVQEYAEKLSHDVGIQNPCKELPQSIKTNL